MPMPRKLISLYVRAGVGAAKLALNVTARVVKLAEGTIGFERPTYGTTGSQPPAEAQPEATREHSPPMRPQATVYDETPLTPLTPEEERAKSIDDEPELVEELAEPGAEQGAGAAIEVDEPWEGYRAMHADDVIDRIETATTAELAVVELYEQAHKQRPTVLTAAERRLKAITGPAARGA
jgi:hypothetical protein